MARLEEPPFGRGETYYNIFASSTQNTNDGTNFEGREFWFEDQNWGATTPGAKPTRSGQFVKCRIVRNIASFALLPGRLANLALTPNANGVYGGQVDGYASTLAQRAYPIDEFLPAAGVQPNDLFFVVVEGPAAILTDLATLSPAISVGDKVIAQTAVTSGATTAGRIVDISANTGSATAIAQDALGYLGHAMSAATANQTNTSILVDMGRR